MANQWPVCMETPRSMGWPRRHRNVPETPSTFAVITYHCDIYRSFSGNSEKNNAGTGVVVRGPRTARLRSLMVPQKNRGGESR